VFALINSQYVFIHLRIECKRDRDMTLVQH
jgi:hypothetical protein